MVSSVLTLAVLGLIYGWSIFRAPLQALFPGWTESMLSNAFTILMCFFALGSMAAGVLSKRIPRPLLCLATAAVMLAGFWGASAVDPQAPGQSLAQLYVCYCGLCGLGTGLGYNLITTNVVKWYPDRPGLALGTGLMGYGMGALVMGGLAEALIARFGLPAAFRLLGVGAAGLLAVVSPLMREPKAGDLPGGPEVKEQACSAQGWTLAQVLRTVEFWSLLLWSVVVSAACLLVVNSAASITAYYGAPAVLGLIVSVANGAARVVNGILCDTLGFRKMSAIHHLAILAAGALMLAGGYFRHSGVLTAGLVFTGLAFGFTPASVAIYLQKKFGSSHFSVIYSFFSWGLLAAAVAGPTLCAAIQQRMAAENYYLPVFALMAVYCLAGMLLSVPFRRRADF